MGIVNLTQNLENFGLTDYGNVGRRVKEKEKEVQSFQNL